MGADLPRGMTLDEVLDRAARPPPCKSFFSIGAKPIVRPSEWSDANLPDRLPQAFFDILDRLGREHAGLTVSASHLLVERLISGAQCTVEGIRQGGQTQILGVVDSVH